MKLPSERKTENPENGRGIPGRKRGAGEIGDWGKLRRGDCTMKPQIQQLGLGLG